jgi:hypothetical protein
VPDHSNLLKSNNGLIVLKALAISLLALTIGISQADLFDDDEALEKRYGKPTNGSGSARLYSRGKFTVAALMGEN